MTSFMIGVSHSSFSDTVGIWNHIERAVEQTPNSIAVECPHQQRDHLSALAKTSNGEAAPSNHPNHLTWTYAQLFQAAQRLATALLQPPTGKVIATFMPCGVESALLMWACSIARLTLGACDPGHLLEVRIEHLHGNLLQLRPSAVVVPDENGARAVEEAALSLAIDIPTIFVFAESAPTHWPSLTDVALRGVCDPNTDNDGPDDPLRAAFVIFSSGTSAGKPKGCPRSVRCCDQSIRYGGHVQKYANKPTRALLHTAVFRGAGLSIALATWARSGAVVLVNPQNAKDRLDAIWSHRITDLFVAPSMVYELEHQQAKYARDLSTVEFVMLSGEVIKSEDMVRLSKLFPLATTTIGYGMTEGDGTIVWPKSWLKAPKSTIPTINGVYSVGKTTPGALARISARESLSVAERGFEEGELHINTTSTISSYMLQGESDKSFYEDKHGRWFKTGDLAIVDKFDQFYVMGRIKDIIRRESIPINPLALESSIEALTGSKTVVVAIPSDMLGEEPFAVLESLNGVTRDEICRHIVEKFGDDFAMRGAATLAEIGLRQFPVIGAGKILKREIVARVIESMR